MTASARLRPATLADADFLRELRNDPEVRHQSRQANLVTEEEHRRWLKATLSQPQRRRLYVIESEGISIGQVRLDRNRKDAEVSIALVASARGAGAGRAAIDAAAALADSLGIHVLHAFVKETNAASLKLFAGAGYSERSRHEGFVELTARTTPGD